METGSITTTDDVASVYSSRDFVTHGLPDGSTILVTGGAGLLGHGIRESIKAFKDGRYQTYGIDWDRMNFIWLSSNDGDLKNLAECEQMFAKHKPSGLIHLAARVGGLFANSSDNLGFFLDNMNINMNVTKCAHKYGVKEAIFCLSTCVLSPDAPLPLTESSLHCGPPHFSNEGYAYSKRMLELMVRHYREAYGYHWICVIPTNIFGTHDSYNLETSHVIPGMMHRMYLAQRDNKPFCLWGTGKARRQFIFSEDAGRFILWLLELGAADKIKSDGLVTLCPTEDDDKSIEEVAECVRRCLKFELEVIRDESKAEGVFKKTATNAKLREILGDKYSLTDFETAMHKSVSWFVENYDTCRK